MRGDGETAERVYGEGGAFQGIVRFWKGWCGASNGGVAIPPVVARIFSGDSTSPLTREARVWCGARDSAENLIDGADEEQSLRLDGRKVW